MKHKKKRNVGITYRLITSEITKNLINENTQLASRFLKIIKKRFRPGTQLNKELSLYNSLLSEGLRSDAVALRLIDDVIADQLAYDIAQKIQEEMEYPGQIKVTVIREVRKISYAK